MKSENYGVEDRDRAFNSKYRNENGKIRWDKLLEDSAPLPNITFPEILDRIRKQQESHLKKKREEGQSAEENTTDNAS